MPKCEHGCDAPAVPAELITDPLLQMLVLCADCWRIFFEVEVVD